MKIGDKCGRLTIIKFSRKAKGYQKIWLCKCDCGTIKEIRESGLKRGSAKSCGCYNKEVLSKRKTHGKCFSSEYRSWAMMKDRCLNKNNPRWHRYGGRGITVCEKWLKFEGFYEDMGDKVTNTSIDRIDNDGNYCKENCKWSTNIEQAKNKTHVYSNSIK